MPKLSLPVARPVTVKCQTACRLGPWPPGAAVTVARPVAVGGGPGRRVVTESESLSLRLAARARGWALSGADGPEPGHHNLRSSSAGRYSLAALTPARGRRTRRLGLPLRAAPAWSPGPPQPGLRLDGDAQAVTSHCQWRHARSQPTLTVTCQ